jgi:hypothetical protein
MQKLHIKIIPSLYLFLSIGILWPFMKLSSQEYFQQEVNHTIHVTLNDVRHELNAHESVEYINNSPDTLSFLYFHLWPNAYSNNKTELARQIFAMNGKSRLFNDPELQGLIDSVDFAVDGKSVRWDLLPETPDICKIILNKPVKHGDTIIITTPFHVKLPKGIISRLGHIGESYQISQWYPKPAVYDVSGWHEMPYLDQGEFYSEFGSFDVSITLPANYIVGATGNLQNEDEMKMLDMISADSSWLRNPYIISTDFPESSKQMKTLRFRENHIHDFAWFADKRFHVLKGKIELPDSKREVTTWAMFTDQEAHLWRNAITYINNAIRNFSKWIGDYPYNTFTAVQSALNSGAGMEYPGLTVIGLAGDPYLLDEVLAHEICHSWFYSAIGSDERRFPYMDESIASAYESRYLNEQYPGKMYWEIGFRNRKLAKFFHIDEMPAQQIQELEWLVPARQNLEQPINLAATDYSYSNYGTLVYYKAAHGFNYLRSYLGDSLFDSVMHDYYRKWNNRHPYPQDLRAAFESGTLKDLSWFFDDFLGTTKRLDYKLIRFKNGKLLLKNKGELNSPLVIAGKNANSEYTEFWENGFEGKKWVTVPWENTSEIKIDPGHKMPEFFRINNNIRTSGICPGADPFQFRFLYTVEDIGKQTLLFLPVLNWNRADGFMAGLVLNNGTTIPKPLEYIFIPFYSFGNQRLSGYGKISLNITPRNNLIRIATFTIEGEQFGAPGNQNYQKAKFGLDVGLRPLNIVNPVHHKIFGYFLTASDLPDIELLMPAKMRSYLQFGYNLERNGLVNPFNILVSFESGKFYQKTFLDLNYIISYNGRKSGFETRFFAGVMLKNNSADPIYRFSPGGRSGREGYLYNGLYPDRFTVFPNTFWSRQMSLTEGGLVSPVNDILGYSQWLLSLSFASSLPAKTAWIPVKPFLNLLLNDHGTGTDNNSHLFFEAGFKAGVWNLFEVYFPLLVSDNIKAITGSYKDRIRFVFKLDLFNNIRLK